MRVLNCDKQLHDSHLSRGEVKSDVDYLIKCLSIDRNTSYEIIDQPDTKNRRTPQPDYLVKDCKTGNLMTIEHSRLVESQDKEGRKANSVNNSPERLHSWWLNIPTPDELVKRLSEFVYSKLSKGQFNDFSHTERILLVRDIWGGITFRGLFGAGGYFKLTKPVSCDHFYLILIADPIIVEVF